VLDKPDGKVIASASGKVHAHMNWSWPQDGERGHIMNLIRRRAKEFATVTPIEEVVSLYYWTRRNDWAELRNIIGSSLEKRADEMIAKYPYTLLLKMARSLGTPEEARYDAAEKFLAVVMDRAPAGGRHWRSAVLALAEILIAARAKPQEGLALLARLKQTKPTVEMTGNWQTAEAKGWHCLTKTVETAGPPDGLKWSNTALPLEAKPKEGRGIWLAKEVRLPASRKGKDLVVNLGKMPGSGIIYFNGRPVGRPWQWPDGNIVIPAAMQRPGGTNLFAALFQHRDPPGYFAKRPPPPLKISGPPRGREKGYLEYPMVLYTTNACSEIGVNYAYYEGKWNKLPDFDKDKLKPIKQGKLDRIDLAPRGRDNFFAMRFTGYMQAKAAGAFKFNLACDNGCRLYVDSKMVIDHDGNHNMGERKEGQIQLAEGTHHVTLTYYQADGPRGLNVTLPNTFIPAAEAVTRRLTADALLGMAQNKKAKAILTHLNPHAWPIPEKTRLRLTGELRTIRRWARGAKTDADTALNSIDSWLHRHPMLRMDPEFMGTKIEAYAEMGDYARAFTLAEQMLRVDMNGHQRRQLMLAQVKSRIKAAQMDTARELYEELKKIAPYSTATVQAREAIKEAVSRE